MNSKITLAVKVIDMWPVLHVCGHSQQQKITLESSFSNLDINFCITNYTGMTWEDSWLQSLASEDYSLTNLILIFGNIKNNITKFKRFSK